MKNILKTINYDESRVPEYELPSALVTKNGKSINNATEWTNYQREYVLKLFEEYMYGKLPPRPKGMYFEVLNVKENALDGLAVRKEIRIRLMNNGMQHDLNVLLYIPNNVKTAPPVFLGLNFYGNQTVSKESDISMSKSWMRSNPDAGIINFQATEASRGKATGRWQAEKIIKRGYALATIYYGDVYPDNLNGIGNSIYRLFPYSNGKAISAWAWGLSRGMDYLESDSSLDCNKVAVIGHSRLGKAALWAGANDQRFALIISNESGCAGAAITRRRFGETIECFPGQNVGYWCVEKFYEYAKRENELPVDQHMLISLAAPRPAYIASASEDLWADPYGEFLAAVHAAPVYKLFGSQGLGCDKMPKVNQSIQSDIGYHIRSGKHGITETDWNHYLAFADKHIKHMQ